MPEHAGHDVTERVGEIVGDDLRVAGGAGGERDHHGVDTPGGVRPGRAGPLGRRRLEFGFEVDPTLAGILVLGDKFKLHRLALVGALVKVCGAFAVGGDDHRFDLGGVAAIDVVLGLEHVGRRHDDRAELVATHHKKPEQIAAFEHEQHPIAFADAARVEVVRRAVGFPRHVGEREDLLLVVIRHPHHRPLVRRAGRDLVDHVVREVKVVRAGDLVILLCVLEGFEIVPRAPDKLFVYRHSLSPACLI